MTTTQTTEALCTCPCSKRLAEIEGAAQKVRDAEYEYGVAIYAADLSPHMAFKSEAERLLHEAVRRLVYLARGTT